MIFNYILSILLFLLFLGVILIIIFDDGDSGKKIAWLLLITVLPVVGIVLYLLFGISYRRPEVFRNAHKATIEKFAAETDGSFMRLLGGKEHLDELDTRFRPLAEFFLGSGTVSSLSGGNSFEIITSGQRKLDLLLKDIREAKHSIHVEYFHFGKDKGSRQVKELLEQKAREGVEVRFLNENIANMPVPSTYYNKMRRSGIEVERFTSTRQGLLSVPMRLNYRNHRKIVVIDGRIGYTGGMNINDNYFFQWRDTHLRLEGRAVAALQTVFIDSWLSSGGKLKQPLPAYFHDFDSIPDGPLRDKLVQIVPGEADSRWPAIQMGYEWLFHNAREYIYLQTPYFVPPESFLLAMKSAALRGVDVRLMLPAKVDTPLMGAANTAYYSECLEAGVRIFERGGEFIHAKTVVCDDYLSQIGTANIDIRSFDINHEVNAYIYDRQTALECKRIFDGDLALSKEITLKQWKESRHWYESLLSRFMRLFSGLL